MAGSSLDEIPHALVVPISGHSHVVGSMLLSQSLSALGFKVSFIYFSSHYAKLKETNRLVLPSAELNGDPSNCNGVEVENTSGVHGRWNGGVGDGGGKVHLSVLEDGLAPDDIDKRFFVSPAMKENLYSYIVELREHAQPATCIISDSFVPWTLEVAQRAGIPRIELCTSNALAYLMMTHLHVLYSEGILPEKGSPNQWKRETPLMLSHIPGLPPFSSELLPNNVRFMDPKSNPNLQLFNQVVSCAKSGERILINTLSELEPDAFKSFEVQGIRAYAIGPLPTHLKKQTDVHTECLSWLDLQAECSVIYVAFGSVAKLSVEEMQELAMGLEASGSPFLWVIREDAADKTEELSEVLPEGFLGRTGGKGMVINWAPQVEVLAHKAIGGFLSHCGWNSTVESLWAGVPILCCPQFAEQRFNAHYLCNAWGAGLELGHTDTGGLERSLVKLGVKSLLHGEEGLKARSKAQEIRHLIERTSQQGGQSFSNLQKLYDDMKALCSKARPDLSK